ncbi:MAG TPA: lipid A biosynthesis acyltransferase [Candidatus Aminicenantes bacterium]|nr:lipid A biosynthesis acyltransferase [Candidatus Aminicenantes bacterium]
MSTKPLKFMDFAGFGLFRLFGLFTRLLPRRACLWAGQTLGTLAFRVDRKHGRIALANLEKALGREAGPDERRRIARDSFRNFGRVTADILKWTSLKAVRRQELLKIEGEEHIRRALRGGRGVLVFSAHFGNWEVAAQAIAKLGPLNVVARPLDNPLIEARLAKFRNRLGAKVISKFQAAKSILQALRRNEIVAILIDQNVQRKEAVFVDFFGLAAATTPGLASFHLRTRSPLIPVFCHPAPHSSYLVEVGAPLFFEPGGDSDRDVLKITQASTKMIEAEIRRKPGLWFWFHNRWKTRPETETNAEPPAGQKIVG